jgi:ribosomal protein S18 acetylase RimI-like enzyme
MNIRLLNASDAETWKKLRLDALKEAPKSFGSSYEEEFNYSLADWQASLNKSDVFAAFCGTDLMGVAGFYSLSQLKTKHRGVLFGLYTLPAYRGQGTASALMKKIITHAKSRVCQLHLSCVTSNISAIALYQKYGFTIYGTEPCALKIGAQCFDEYLMILNLNHE